MDNNPLCPKCGTDLEEIYENTGWDGLEGPRHDEVTGYKCPVHGPIEPASEDVTIN